MTENEAKAEINKMSFPAVQEGDEATHEGYTFVYTSGEWIKKELE